MASRALPFHTCGVTMACPASNRRTASNAVKPQFSSFWLSSARAFIEVVFSSTLSNRRLPPPAPLAARFGNSRAAEAIRQ